jgi:hypothetical protein
MCIVDPSLFSGPLECEMSPRGRSKDARALR